MLDLKELEEGVVPQSSVKEKYWVNAMDEKDLIDGSMDEVPNEYASPPPMKKSLIGGETI